MSLIEDIRVIPSGGRELRRFGLVLGCALALAGGYCIWRGRWCALPACAAAAAILIAGAAMPRLLLPLQKAWMALALALGWVATRVILAALFFCVVTPLGLIARLAGKRFLEMRFERDATTYWERRERREDGDDRWEKQF